jgi:endoglucanase
LIALRPRPLWFGTWDADSEAKSVAQSYIANVTHGRDDVLAQMVVFRLDPWEQVACAPPPDAAQQASYRRWTDGFASGIGSARVALVLQPDLPEALCGSGYSRVPVNLVAYSARAFGSLPHATVYIDAGAADWETVHQAVSLLRASGIRHARGFALNDTHYDSTQNEIIFGQKVVRGLAGAGVPGRHFVINTAENGHPFTYGQHQGNFQEPVVCATRGSRRCASLGIPPTTDVTNPRWHLSRVTRAIAARLVDAYLWVGRPWLYYGSDPFELQRALALARTTPF